MDDTTNVLLLGLGNVLMGDDGLGIRVLERIQEVYDIPRNLTCLDGGVMGLQLLSRIEGVSHLLAIDAVQTGEAPGTVVTIGGNDVPKCLAQKLSMHQINFQEILALCLLRGTEPPNLLICGMVPATLEFGLGLSETVECRLPELELSVLQALNAWGLNVTPKVSDT